MKRNPIEAEALNLIWQEKHERTSQATTTERENGAESGRKGDRLLKCQG